MTYHVFVNAEKFPQFSEKFPLVGRWGTLAVIEVREDQVAELYAMVYALTGLEDGCTLIDENHRGYRPRADGSAVLMDKNTKWPYAAKEWEKDYQSSMKGLNKEISARDALLREYGADAREEDGSILSYKPGRYVSKTHNLWFPYRVKYAKKPGQPLLVFFHGGGEVGTDNIRPLWNYLEGPYPEWFPARKRRPLFKRDFTVLIPQSTQSGAYEYHDYIAAVKDLCEQIAEEAQTDMTRIYCMGGSWGGAGTWLSAYLFPDFYACAMPMMGELYHPDLPWPPTPETLSHMKALPIWVSHSADDTVVSIDRDDATVAVLRELGAPVKYTRVNGKGHHYLVPYFLKTEPWAEWMFAQKRSP